MDDALVAVLARELRAAVGLILGCAGTLQNAESYLTAAQRADLLHRISDQAHHLVGLAGNVLCTSRPVERAPCCASVDAVIQRAVADATVRHQPRRVRTHVGAGLHTGMDPASMHVVVLNLVSNALRFAAPGSRVDVTARPDGDRIGLEVCNVGPPIAAADRERIFEPFVAGVTGGDPAPGFGYGLYVVRSLVEAHGGDVTVDSMEDRVTFAVVLPAVMPPQVDAEESRYLRLRDDTDIGAPETRTRAEAVHPAVTGW